MILMEEQTSWFGARTFVGPKTMLSTLNQRESIQKTSSNYKFRRFSFEQLCNYATMCLWYFGKPIAARDEINLFDNFYSFSSSRNFSAMFCPADLNSPFTSVPFVFVASNCISLKHFRLSLQNSMFKQQIKHCFCTVSKSNVKIFIQKLDFWL